jgi:hypothetical protein
VSPLTFVLLGLALVVAASAAALAVVSPSQAAESDWPKSSVSGRCVNVDYYGRYVAAFLGAVDPVPGVGSDLIDVYQPVSWDVGTVRIYTRCRRPSSCRRGDGGVRELVGLDPKIERVPDAELLAAACAVIGTTTWKTEVAYCRAAADEDPLR